MSQLNETADKVENQQKVEYLTLPTLRVLDRALTIFAGKKSEKQLAAAPECRRSS